MRWSKRRVIGGALILLVGVVLIYNWQASSTSPAEKIRAVYAELGAEHEELRQGENSDAVWELFEKRAEKRLAPILSDLEEDMPGEDVELLLLYQVGKYDIPRIIKTRAAWDLPRAQRSHWNWSPRFRKPKKTSQPAWYQDPVTLLIGLVDVWIVVWMFQLSRRWRKEDRLRYFDRKLAKHPDSVPYRGHRARLRAALGERAGALADIDWLLEREPPGVDLKSLRALRDSLCQ